MGEKSKSEGAPPKTSRAKPGTQSKKAPKSTKTARLDKEVKNLKSSLAELEDRHLRLRAEFDNYRKRKQREIARLLQYEGEGVILRFLSVVDDLGRIVRSADGGKSENLDSLVEGINLTLDKLMKRLKELQVEPFESVGQLFDPEFHEAMMTQESGEHGDHEITEEFEKGYMFKDRVIRHAKVVVNSAPRDESEE